MATNKQVFEFRRSSLGAAQFCTDANARRVLISCLPFESVTIMGATVGTTAWSSAVVTVRVSNDIDGPWFAVPGGSVTLGAAGITTAIDVTAFGYLALETTTAQASVVADFLICGYGRK